MRILSTISKVSSMTFISRILGFLRDVLLAHFFGASEAFDAYLVAAKIPNFMRRLFAEGAFSQSFVPVLISFDGERKQVEKEQFLDRVFSLLVLITVGLTVLVVLFPQKIITLFAPGFSGGDARFAISSQLLRYTFPYLAMITVCGFFTGVLHTQNRFSLPALAPSLMNILLISAACLPFSLYAGLPIANIALAYPIAGLLQCGLLAWAYRQKMRLPRFRLDCLDKGVIRVLYLMSAGIYSISVGQIGLMFDTMLASFLPKGSLGWLYYSERLSYLVLGVFGVAIATVLLPAMSRYHQQGQPKQFKTSLAHGAKWCCMIGIPAAVGLMMFAKPIILTLFFRGAFGAYDVNQTAASLVILAAGIPAFMLIKVLAGAFFAKEDTTRPMYSATFGLVVNMIVSLSSVFWLGHCGIALAVCLSAYANVGMLSYFLVKYQKIHLWQTIWQDVCKVILASGMMCPVGWLSPVAKIWLGYAPLEQCLQLSCLILLSLMSYLGVMALLYRLAPNSRYVTG